jgi:chromatin segregation and condensation protein Rec8/ScpA/Scc1 (kleisin family)
VGPDPEAIRSAADPLLSLTIRDLTRALEALLDDDVQGEIDASHITVAPVPISEVGRKLLDALLEAPSDLSFREVVGFAQSRYEVVVCFLVLLEAFRLGLIGLEGQDGVEVSIGALGSEAAQSRFQALLEELA